MCCALTFYGVTARECATAMAQHVNCAREECIDHNAPQWRDKDGTTAHFLNEIESVPERLNKQSVQCCHTNRACSEKRKRTMINNSSCCERHIFAKSFVTIFS